MNGEGIREVRTSDEATLAAFFIANDRPEIIRTFHPFPLDASTAQRLAQQPGRNRYFGCFRGETLLGFAMLRGWEEGYAVPSFGLLVDHREQGRGLGRRLTEHALTVARELGCDTVRLTVGASNERARRIYERAGFQLAERLPGDRLLMLARLTLGQIARER